MSTLGKQQEAVVLAPIHDPASDAARHAAEAPHSAEEEIAHAKLHAKENIFWFVGFFTLILCAVANYEFFGTTNYLAILGLAAARCLLIAFFMNWLFHSYSLVFRTFLFTVVFLSGMVFLSWWDSTLPHMGNPIFNTKDPHLMQP